MARFQRLQPTSHHPGAFVMLDADLLSGCSALCLLHSALLLCLLLTQAFMEVALCQALKSGWE